MRVGEIIFELLLTVMLKVGEGEKMVRALFAVATVNQPSVVFIDEVRHSGTFKIPNTIDSALRLIFCFFGYSERPAV